MQGTKESRDNVGKYTFFAKTILEEKWPLFQKSCTVHPEIFSEGARPAQMMEVSTSKLLYEIRHV
jgi:hypothetical protein